VPGSAKYGTMPGFCVMQREARTSASAGALTAGTDAGLPPAASIDWYEAKQACQNIGSGYHLVTEPEWLTLAENLANASSSNLGTSSEKTLSNRQPVYDLASSLSEWVDKYVSSDAEKPKPLSENWAEYSSISDYGVNKKIRPFDDLWSSADGIGRIISNSSGNQTKAYVRGGADADGSSAGLWSLRLDKSPTDQEAGLGFRCVK
jgi:formylglycine-generating enzyme required for sulfatase activity